ncbi:flagellar type III secretion system pore protein FliP [Anaerocolumna sp. AGMB13020]|uniref:flagellar type III secretion system pore protein FliP n=1 Tax=Anaerocolumna sp. AGMB13020 TaxID=3081750 RepID=UPI0029533968|nr:flagellar type III secretion system pore protein FliP [Anaerocolumna sp. AGMB13020]WOO36544.1 flagellar type III secretion system pore protein FliP [Anaerocolumna sp. AGMB13020]
METRNRRILKRLVCIIFILFITGILTTKMAVPVLAAQTDGTTDTNTTNNTGTGTGTDNNLNGQIGPFQFNLDTGSDNGGLTSTLQIMLVITLISLAPSILIMVTSFTRIIIVLHFVRSALGTQTTPPNQVLIGLALFLTFFIMSPVFTTINDNAIKPLTAGDITQEEAFEAGIKPLRDFMMEEGNTRPQDLRLFMDIAQIGTVDNLDEIPMTVVIPAFIISELRAAFIIGFLIYIPFIIIDMVVASTLMSMGMMMLPPTTISMPFKILLFILADGWNLVIGTLVKTFY